MFKKQKLLIFKPFLYVNMIIFLQTYKIKILDFNQYFEDLCKKEKLKSSGFVRFL